MLKQITTPYLTEATIEYLKQISELKFLFQFDDSDVFETSLEVYELNVAIYSKDLNYNVSKRAKRALKLTTISDMFLYDDCVNADGAAERI